MLCREKHWSGLPGRSESRRAGSAVPKARHRQGCDTPGAAAQVGARGKSLSLKASSEKEWGSPR